LKNTKITRLFLTAALDNFGQCDEALSLITSALMENKTMTLQELYLASNHVSIEGIESISKLLECRHCSLTFLDLSRNDVQYEHKFKPLMTALSKNRSLTTLSLDVDKPLATEQERLLAQTMKQNRHLSKLHLFNEEVASYYQPPKLQDPVSASVIGYRLMLNRNRTDTLPCIEAFLMATTPPSAPSKPNQSSIYSAFSSSDLYDRNLLFMIFELAFG